MSTLVVFLEDIALVDWLVLIPTELERAAMPLFSANTVGTTGNAIVELCGFGPIAAAANTARLLQVHRPTKVLLLGIAGAFEVQNSIGQALCFSDVASYGVGTGTGEAHIPGHKLGFKQVLGGRVSLKDQAAEILPLVSESTGRRLLVTACSASANEAERNERLKMFPDAVAEDMEGFGVALACHQNGTPLSIVRGISNRVGDRNRDNWRIDAALHSASELGIRIISRTSQPT